MPQRTWRPAFAECDFCVFPVESPPALPPVFPPVFPVKKVSVGTSLRARAARRLEDGGERTFTAGHFDSCCCLELK
jgi:hypothetical protein